MQPRICPVPGHLDAMVRDNSGELLAFGIETCSIILGLAGGTLSFSGRLAAAFECQ
jgi:hypothetical protein